MKNFNQFFVFILLSFLINNSLLSQINSGDDRQDFTGMNFKVAKDTTFNPNLIDGNKVSAYYEFIMKNDSTSMKYMISEVRKNNNVIKLENWHKGQIVQDIDGKLLNGISRTENFILNIGDTLSCYRQFTWTNYINKTRKNDNFYSLDTLDYSIELVRASNGSRIKLIDSFGVNSKVPSGYPSFHGNRPIFSKIKFISGIESSGDSVFLRVKLYSRGNGPFYFVRADFTSVGISDLLLSPTWVDFINIYGGSLPKLILNDQSIGKDEKSNIKVYQNLNEFKKIYLKYKVENIDKGLNIGIYNNLGELVFMPLINSFENENIINCVVPNSGNYFVNLFDGQKILSTKKINIK